ncbi:MAG: hypothetical protein J6O71_06700 [Lachnospiraceae bacterium]|nr:hypothetical protein [Lachnospiraceae bacterium]
MSIWDIYLDLDAIEAKRAYKKRLKQQQNENKARGSGGKNAKGSSKLPLIITVSALSVVLLCTILLIVMLLTGWAPNPLTRAINRSRTVGLFETYIQRETGTKVNLNKVRKDITQTEEIQYYDDIIEPFTADPGIIATWFEYLRMDEWDFTIANEDIMLDIENSDTDTLLALCARHGYPEFESEYGYILSDGSEEEAEAVEEEEEPVEEAEEEELIEEPEEAVISEDALPEIADEPVSEDYEEVAAEETPEEEYTEEDLSEDLEAIPEETEEEIIEETEEEDGEYEEEEMTFE